MNRERVEKIRQAVLVKARAFGLWTKLHKKQLLIAFAGVLALIVIAQVVYPSNRTVLFLQVDRTAVGGMTKEDAAQRLNKVYAEQSIGLMLNDQESTTITFAPADVGLSAHNEERVERYDYPLLWRLVPTSMLWYHLLQPSGEPTYERDAAKAQVFMAEQFGKECITKPQDASIKAEGDSLTVVRAKSGGKCSAEDVSKKIAALTLSPNASNELRITVDSRNAAISTEDAEKLARLIEDHSESGVELAVKDETVKVSKEHLYQWLEFSVKDNQLVTNLSTDKAADYLGNDIAPKVAVPAGETFVTTHDFTVVSENKGKTGVALNQAATLTDILAVMLGKQESAKAVTQEVQPKVLYTRSYSKTSTGIAAMLQHYAEDHAGVFGVSFTELSGGKRAEYNSSQQFITASTYKLFVAYGTLRKIESNEWKWDDPSAGGRTVGTCFDDMIIRSDNPCAEDLYQKIGYKKTIEDVRALGLSNTVLDAEAQKTTAGDLTLFLTKLYDGSIGLKDENRERLINVMKQNIHRSGIPAGANGTVADKVGFLNGLLHDAAIVYSPKGNYVLTVMSSGGTWGNIAEITRNIEALR